MKLGPLVDDSSDLSPGIESEAQLLAAWSWASHTTASAVTAIAQQKQDRQGWKRTTTLRCSALTSACAGESDSVSLSQVRNNRRPRVKIEEGVASSKRLGDHANWLVLAWVLENGREGLSLKQRFRTAVSRTRYSKTSPAFQCFAGVRT